MLLSDEFISDFRPAMLTAVTPVGENVLSPLWERMCCLDLPPILSGVRVLQPTSQSAQELLTSSASQEGGPGVMGAQ